VTGWKQLLGAAIALCVAGALSGSAAPKPEADLDVFVRRVGRTLEERGRSYRVAGASNYYLMYKSPVMVDHLLETAAASGFNVIRTWGSLDIGNQDGSNSIHGKADGVYFHYWNGIAPAYNDGADGLEHLDYVIYKAGRLGIRLIIPFVNNWNDFGGMDQYVRWRGGQYHDDFYSDPIIRTWYKGWIEHLLTRVNVYTGVAYKDDPTILVWELANEPRCIGAGAYPRSSACTTQTLVDWADDVSTFVKTIDSNHLLSVGDEGFYCIPGAADWTENCSEGVDTLALADLPHIDIASAHLYPEAWGKTPAWGTEWIARHLRDARRIQERAFLGEFGLRNKAIRNPVYKEWTDAVLANGGTGALYWMLADKQDNGTLYPDFDGLTVYCPSPVCTTFSNFVRTILLRGPFSLPPVADHDTAEVEFGAGTTLAATANDVSWRVKLLPDSVDLNPGVPGQQTAYTSSDGRFELLPGGTVAFLPASGFSGTALARYVVYDAKNDVSNVATLSVVVKPDQNAPLKLFSFETGTEGWGPASWQSNAGVVTLSSTFATDGSQSLQVTTAEGGWFGLSFAVAVDLSGRTTLKFDIKTTAAGTSRNAAIQVGNRWQWCQASWGWINPHTVETVEIDLQSLDCGVTDLSLARSIYVWFSGGGVYHLDHVRSE
jgi:mannan endo-1,4-beta-mannosidase